MRISDWSSDVCSSDLEELTGYLKNMLKATQKSVFEHVVYDSDGVERTFAEQLEKNEAVKVYAKLPGWFKVPTLLGTYNPDWAAPIGRAHVCTPRTHAHLVSRLLLAQQTTIKTH